MKGRPVEQLVYEQMFPKPRSTDPQNFHALLQRSLILEVRQEVHSFYGHLDTQEAKYPGLDYCHRTHRLRLSRWPWHRRLFRAFDHLGLTDAEISGLTKWEGTKWAKERFEKEQGILIRDTTSDGFPDWVEPEDRVGGVRRPFRALFTPMPDETETADEDMGGDESEEEMESVGLALNERLRERAARREAGDTSTVLDEEWEQWLKNAIENGQLSLGSENIFQVSDEFPNIIPQSLFPPGMLSAARAGQWSEIPDFLHDMIRRTLETEQPSGRASQATTQLEETSRESTPEVPSRRRTYSDLRLPLTQERNAVRPRRGDIRTRTQHPVPRIVMGLDISTTASRNSITSLPSNSIF